MKKFFDFCHASVPVDRVAVWVSLRGENFVPNKVVLTNDSKTPIATRPFTKVELNQDCFVDLRGRKFGRFTVIGISRDFSRQWVVRCSCGIYTTRSAKAIKNKKNDIDMCEHCRHLAFLKREESYRRTGKDTDIRNFV